MQPLTDQQLQQFQLQLMDLQQELFHFLEISSTASDVVTLDQSRVGRLLRMDALQQQQMSQASRAAYRARLLAVERALKLFETGDYGYCEACGEYIDPRRLEIKPEYVYCLG